VLELNAAAEALHVSEHVLDYIQMLVEATRTHAALRAGLSPRATLALLKTARARALLKGREYVLPDDVKQIFEPLAAHRLQSSPNSGTPEDAVEQILDETRVP